MRVLEFLNSDFSGGKNHQSEMPDFGIERLKSEVMYQRFRDFLFSPMRSSDQSTEYFQVGILRAGGIDLVRSRISAKSAVISRDRTRISKANYQKIHTWLSDPEFRRIILSARIGKAIHFGNDWDFKFSTFAGDKVRLDQAKLVPYCVKVVANSIIPMYLSSVKEKNGLWKRQFRSRVFRNFRNAVRTGWPNNCGVPMTSIPASYFYLIPETVKRLVERMPSAIGTEFFEKHVQLRKATAVAIFTEVWIPEIESNDVPIALEYYKTVVGRVECLLKILLMNSPRATTRENAGLILPNLGGSEC